MLLCRMTFDTGWQQLQHKQLKPPSWLLVSSSSRSSHNTIKSKARPRMLPTITEIVLEQMLSLQDHALRIPDRWQHGKDQRQTIKFRQMTAEQVGTMMLHRTTTFQSVILSDKMSSSTSTWATWPSPTLALKTQDHSSLNQKLKLLVWARLAAVRQIAAKTHMRSIRS